MRRAIAMLLWLAAAQAPAAEVLVDVNEGKLGARVDGLAFPATLWKDLTSGLTNRIYAQVTLAGPRATVGEKVVEVAIRYDLWDQTFSVVTAVNGTTVETRTLASPAEVNSLLAALPLPRIFDIPTLSATGELTMRIEVLLNPIDREKLRMIRKWVAQNSTPEAGPNRGLSMSNALFNRIFEQYADGSNVAAVWRAAVESRPFRLDQLKQ
jgi:hypothetical protein